MKKNARQTKKSSQPKAKQAAKPKAKSKAPGGGGAKKRCGVTPHIDSTPEKKSAMGDAESTMLDAVRFLADDKKWTFDGAPYVRDQLTLEALSNKEHALSVMKFMGLIMRKGLANIIVWNRIHHDADIKQWAGELLADLVTWLELDHIVKLKLAAKQQGPAFDARWQTLHPDGRGPSDYAVIRPFAVHLLRSADDIAREVFSSWEEPSKHEPPYVGELRRLMSTVLLEHVRAGHLKEGQRITWDIFHHAWKFLCRAMPFRDPIWKRILWPLAKDLWPPFARKREHFTGIGKWKLGRPLSDRKRPVDGKTDFGVAYWESAIRRMVDHALGIGMMLNGDGFTGSTGSSKSKGMKSDDDAEKSPR